MNRMGIGRRGQTGGTLDRIKKEMRTTMAIGMIVEEKGYKNDKDCGRVKAMD